MNHSYIQNPSKVPPVFKAYFQGITKAYRGPTSSCYHWASSPTTLLAYCVLFSLAFIQLCKVHFCLRAFSLASTALMKSDSSESVLAPLHRGFHNPLSFQVQQLSSFIVRLSRFLRTGTLTAISSVINTMSGNNKQCFSICILF